MFYSPVHQLSIELNEKVLTWPISCMYQLKHFSLDAHDTFPKIKFLIKGGTALQKPL